MNFSLNKKLNRLKNILKKMDSVLVAFSGGSDSSLLLKVAHDVLAKRAFAVIISSVFMSEREIIDAKNTAREIGIKYKIVKRDILKNEIVNKNPPRRCYFCKKQVMRTLLDLTGKHGFNQVVEGSNTDDFKQYRPGKKALTELKIRSPLAEAGLNKIEIRELLRGFGFKNWNKPSSGCLATRFPYGIQLTKKALRAVSVAEELLRGLGFSQVRVRIHNEIARIEVEKNKINKLIRLLDNRAIKEIKKTGVKYICVDAQGYRSGSMDKEASK